MPRSVFPDPPPINSAPVKRPEARIWLDGKPGKRKGRIIIHEAGELPMPLILATAQYAVIYALAEKCAEDAGLPEWMSRGFLTTEQLQQRLSEYGVKSPWYATRHVFRARQTLSTIGPIGGIDGRTWSHEFLETSDLDAYRLSLLPKNVHFL
jgi:hypothetical protein